MMRFVERHREIRRALDFPVREDLGLRQVRDFDFLFIGNIHKNARSSLFQLKGFGMRAGGDLCGPLAHGAETLERAAPSGPRYLARQEFFSSEADDDVLAPGVIAHIVGVQIERHSLQKLKRRAVKDLHGSVAAARDEESIGLGVKIRTLRLVEIGNGVDLPAGLQVDHFERVIIKRCRKQTLALYVAAHIIHAPSALRYATGIFPPHSPTSL